MKASFNDVITANQKRLRFIARRYGDQAHEEDVYQEILLQLWRSFESFRGQADIATWLYRIGLNAALMWQRKEGRKREVSSDVLIDTEVPSGQCQAGLLEDFFNVLNEIDGMVLMMHLDDIPLTDIADILGISRNAVNIRINRLKQRFNERYVD